MKQEIYSITTENERICLAELATQIHAKGTIVEIGALYGGVTAVLALAAPLAKVISIDNFSWHPQGMQPTSKKLLLENMRSIDANNVSVLEMTSKEAFADWNKNIDLLWIDGGHDFKTVYFDLYYFSSFADVIAMHDYNNSTWPDIKQAVDVFLNVDQKWRLDKVVDQLVVLRRSK